MLLLVAVAVIADARRESTNKREVEMSTHMITEAEVVDVEQEKWK